MDCPTPICDFVTRYAAAQGVRAHMPGHKGRQFIGCEPLDITEIKGADSLYEAEGVIAQSEDIATGLFGSGRTFYSAEGSSQCLKAMLFLAMEGQRQNKRPHILAGRNVHKSFVYACALLDVDISWLMPEGDTSSLCSCPITSTGVERALEGRAGDFFAVYITAPDYLGASPDIAAIAGVCHSHGLPLLVDNAHGAYLRFLDPSRHPIDLGADMCCDSAHKTLPVITGGAYLHISKGCLPRLRKSPREALAMFGSTSPSYLILQSLDMCNRYLSMGYDSRLADVCRTLESMCERLRAMGFVVAESDPLKVTVFDGAGGSELAERLRKHGIECEFADKNAVVMMFTPENTHDDMERVMAAFATHKPTAVTEMNMPVMPYPHFAMTVRQAVFSRGCAMTPWEAVGRICSSPSVSCPPAVPVAVSGEIITKEAAMIMAACGIDEIEVVCQ